MTVGYFPNSIMELGWFTKLRKEFEIINLIFYIIKVILFISLLIKVAILNQLFIHFGDKFMREE